MRVNLSKNKVIAYTTPFFNLKYCGPCRKPTTSFKPVFPHEEFIRNVCMCIQHMLGEAKDTEVNVLDGLIYGSGIVTLALYS